MLSWSAKTKRIAAHRYGATMDLLIRHAFWHPALALRLLQKTARHANFPDLEYGTFAKDCG
jgi:hypothetical protein